MILVYGLESILAAKFTWFDCGWMTYVLGSGVGYFHHPAWDNVDFNGSKN